ncbi:class I SAM-dependent methyltransferase [Streptomyces sp. NPDC101158]|uniref:class I SAM-dependent methyltransferase n=1 Tax=Streptomyces sp. NPDC101158 TaxID=3366117 RepID=UPI00382079AA
MQPTSLTRRLAASPLAPVAVFPVRFATVARHNAGVLLRSGRWLVRSRENACFTYDLTPVNREHLAWFTATVTGRPVGELRGYLDEVESDVALRTHMREVLAAGPRRRTCDHLVRYARRAAVYAVVRALRPEHVVEAGVHRGITSCLIAAALLRNGKGRLTAVDVDPQSGELLQGGPYASVVDRVVGDSVATLCSAPVRERGIDLLVLDTYVDSRHETSELMAALPALRERAVVLSTTSHFLGSLAEWSERHHRAFLHFREDPAEHWHPGEGYGASFPGLSVPGTSSPNPSVSGASSGTAVHGSAGAATPGHPG